MDQTSFRYLNPHNNTKYQIKAIYDNLYNIWQCKICDYLQSTPVTISRFIVLMESASRHTCSAMESMTAATAVTRWNVVCCRVLIITLCACYLVNRYHFRFSHVLMRDVALFIGWCMLLVYLVI